MDHSLPWALVLLLRVLDLFGSLPIVISMMRKVAPLRCMGVALGGRAFAFAVAGRVPTAVAVESILAGR